MGKILDLKTGVPCKWARIFGRLNPKTKQFIAEKIELVAKFVCFTRGIPVLMADGSHVAIEQIKAGDLVMSRDEFTGQTSVQRVKQTFEHQADATLVLRLRNGETIETTEEHPFYVESQGFTAAGEMGIGTSIVTRAGPSAVLASSTVRNRAATVYNFEVENTHTYFVGNSDLWVHNRCWDWVSQANRDWIELVFSKAKNGPETWDKTIRAVLKNPPSKGIAQSEIKAGEWLRNNTPFEWIMDDARIGRLMKQASKLVDDPPRPDALARNPLNDDLMLLSAKGNMKVGELNNALNGFESFLQHQPSVTAYTNSAFGKTKTLVVTYSKDSLDGALGFSIDKPQNVAGVGQNVSVLLKNGVPHKINGITVYMSKL